MEEESQRKRKKEDQDERGKDQGVYTNTLENNSLFHIIIFHNHQNTLDYACYQTKKEMILNFMFIILSRK